MSSLASEKQKVEQHEDVADDLACQKHTLGFLITQAYKSITGKRLVIECSFCDGWWCHDVDDADIDEALPSKVKAQMVEYLRRNEVSTGFKRRAEALEYFEGLGYTDKLGVLKVWRSDPLPVVSMGSAWDYVLHPVSTQCHAMLENGFDVCKYGNGRDGLLLRFPRISRVTGKVQMHPFKPHRNFFDTIERHEVWGEKLGVSTLSELNEKVYNQEIEDLLWVSEAFVEKTLAEIASNVVKEYPQKKIICIAGPSSSGKTTTAKRLSIQLQAQGMYAMAIGMDMYYKNGDDVPNDGPHGMKDWEALTSVDVDLLASRLQKLCSGQSVPERSFDFQTHIGTDNPRKMIRAPENTVIVVEGIHGLNPDFHKKLGHVHKIYVSALTQLNIDQDHHFSTADNRLLRRTLRDYRTRGYGAEETFTRWPMVRAGEEKYIFPHQHNADYVVNTSLIHELPILANYVKPLLAEVRSDLPRVTKETERLYALMTLFYPMTDEKLPRNSVLTEFLGNSAFKDCH